MSGRPYHYLGEVHGELGGANSPFLGLGGTVRTALVACGECGAVVSEGRGREQHDRWHLALTASVGHIPVVVVS